MSRGTQAIINFDNLRHNFKLLKQLAPSKLVLVVKADAYGHGLEQVVLALNNVDCFAVATIDEALLIRNFRPNVRILLLEGFLNKSELLIATDNQFDSVIHQQEQLDLFLSSKIDKKINVWLKYDSGMNRLGFNDKEFSQAIKSVEKHPNLNELVLMSHFASANISSSDFTERQKQNFFKFSSDFQLSLSNSSALLNKDNLTDEWCRVGLSLFGVSPVEGKFAADFGLLPVMSLQTNVIAVKDVNTNQSIGYSQQFFSKKDMKIAIIGIGYGDGYPWSLKSSAYVKINNKKARIVGRVSMDMMAVDISAIESVFCGDSVLIWGSMDQSELPVEIVASNAQTIAYVLLCQTTSRVNYIYV